MRFPKPDFTFVFDMDGTVYLGERVFPEAVSFVKMLREHGGRAVFFTNNASRDKSFYCDRLNRMGFGVSPRDVLTSGDVTISFLKKNRPGKSVYLVGTPLLEKSFREAGIPLSDDGEIVVTSFDTTLTYEKLKNACRLLRAGAEYFSTHPDYNCPTENGPIPDSGAICAFIKASVGVEPRFFGKPHAEAMNALSEYVGESPERMCVVGDRLYTDIALGKKNGVCSLLVLTGETTSSDLVSLPPEESPDLVYPDLASFGEALFR